MSKSIGNRFTTRLRSSPPRGFTLIEILVVVSIIALLLAMLLPSLSRARAQGQMVKCRANLQQIGLGLVLYGNANEDYVVPSYNLPRRGGSQDNFTGGPDQPLDGWAAILDRDAFVPSRDQSTNTTFYCPKTVDVEGMKDGQTGNDPQKPRGWTDWPLKFTSIGGDSVPKVATTIPERGFTKIIRVSYWINAYNSIGGRPADSFAADQHYTASVGLGPDGRGAYLKLRKLRPANPGRLIVAADGIYMGRQAATRIGATNSRIGYRHPGIRRLEGAANVAFADGHADDIAGDAFPRALASSDSAQDAAEKRKENLSGPTVYANPKKVFP